MICLLSLCLFLNVLSPYKSIYIMPIYMIYVVWQEREVYEEHIAALWGASRGRTARPRSTAEREQRRTENARGEGCNEMHRRVRSKVNLI